MADLIELVFGKNIGNRIPVDCGFIHRNTPRKYFCRCWFSRVLPLLMWSFCSFRSSFQNSACSFQKQRNCRYSNFPYFSGFLRCNRQKSLKYQAFRQIQSRPKPPSKITKQPLTYKTRNQFDGNVTRVRIPLSPPTKKPVIKPIAGFFRPMKIIYLHPWSQRKVCCPDGNLL